MIFQGSRYENSDVVRMQKRGATRLTVVPVPPDVTPVFSFAFHTVIEGERIDILADRFFGDAELWWVIADVNPRWSFFDRLPAGTVLRIPNGLRTV